MSKQGMEAVSNRAFQIPKISVPIVCCTVQGERVSGEIFLDVVSPAEYSSQQVLDFFNNESLFFPFRTGTDVRPLLVSKDSIVQVEVTGVLERFLAETSIVLAQRKEADVHLRVLGIRRFNLLLTMPEEYCRIVDLLNLGNTFCSAISGQEFALLNVRHIYKVEEVNHGQAG